MMDVHNNITEKFAVTTGYSVSIKTFFCDCLFMLIW